MFSHILVGYNDAKASFDFCETTFTALGIQGQRMDDRAFTTNVE